MVLDRVYIQQNPHKLLSVRVVVVDRGIEPLKTKENKCNIIIYKSVVYVITVLL